MSIYLKSLLRDLGKSFFKIKEKFDIWGAIWLNSAGMLVLVKYVLSSLPIFQFSSLLAFVGIKNALAHVVHKFLWQGGKSNSKRFFMVVLLSM
jgi:hypothetical protein